MDSPNWMFFWKTSEGGRGGVISDPKNYIADFFGFKTVYFGRKFWKKCPKRGEGGGGHLQSKKFHCKFTQVNAYLRIFAKKRNVISKNGEGGGQRPFGIFPKKHPYLRIHTPLRWITFHKYLLNYS